MSGKHVRRRVRALLGATFAVVAVVGLSYTVAQEALGPHVETDARLALTKPAVTSTEVVVATRTVAAPARTVKVTHTRIITRTAFVRAASRDETRYGLPQSIARELLAARGWSSEWSCLNSLIMRESGWNVHARNPSSGAYGIPQALPAGKMASAGADWRDNPRTQLVWMMGYIKSVYSTPCGAWGHSQKTGWY